MYEVANGDDEDLLRKYKSKGLHTIQNSDGNTVLHLMAKANNPKIYDVIGGGFYANKDIKNKAGQTAFDVTTSKLITTTLLGFDDSYDSDDDDDEDDYDEDDDDDYDEDDDDAVFLD